MYETKSDSLLKTLSVEAANSFGKQPSRDGRRVLIAAARIPPDYETPPIWLSCIRNACFTVSPVRIFAKLWLTNRNESCYIKKVLRVVSGLPVVSGCAATIPVL